MNRRLWQGGNRSRCRRLGVLACRLPKRKRIAGMCHERIVLGWGRRDGKKG